MKKADPRLMLIMSMTVLGTLGPFVRNIPVSSGGLALYRAGNSVCGVSAEGQQRGGERRQDSLDHAFTSLRTLLVKRSNSPLARQT